MFVKIENWVEDKPLILNVEAISSICPVNIDGDFYDVTMINSVYHRITEQQYNELCEILTKRL